MKDTLKQSLAKILPILHPQYLGIYLVIGTAIFGSYYYKSKTSYNRKTIEVNGVAYRDVTADKATWDIEIEREMTGRLESLNKLKEDEASVRAFLAENGIEDNEIGGGLYDTWATYQRDEDNEFTDEIKGYKSDVYFRVSTSDVHKISNLASTLNTYVVENDIFLSRDDRDYIYTGLEGLKIDLLKEAIENAKDRAVALSGTTGNRIGDVEDASQGVFQINSRGDYSVSGGGNFDTSTISKTVRATVTVDFEVK